MFTALEEFNFLIEPQIRPYCGPIFFAHSPETADGKVTANGSFGLVDTGKKKLLVTCHHVWKDFQDLREKDSALKLLVYLDQKPPVVFELMCPIDQDERLDIVTFDIEPLLKRHGGRNFYPLNRNPARKVAKDDYICFLGYPGLFRLTTENVVMFGRAPYMIFVSDVSGLHFCADISEVELVGSQKPELAGLTKSYGGISGSPCFLISNGLAQLVGFANSVVLNILRFTHARCLNGDGTINRHAL